MIIIRLHSGLGNQLFQYAMGRRVSRQLGVALKIDLTILSETVEMSGYVPRKYGLDIFKCEPAFYPNPRLLQLMQLPGKRRLSNLVRKITATGYAVLEQQHFAVEENLLTNPPNNVIYKGYWQSEKYFKSCAEQLRRDLEFRSPLLPHSRTLGNRMQSSDSVCVHVRRTDMVNSAVHGVTDYPFFKRCIEQIRSRRSHPLFFVFSDDLPWCRSAFVGEENFVFVGAEHDGLKDGNALQLMTYCKHFIIPNSTFSWWAAWLAEGEDSIIMAPDRWFGTDKYVYRDVVPERWLRIKN